MVFLYARAGQLANKLFQLGTFIGNAIENDYSLHCEGFEDYYDLFEDLNQHAGKYNVRFVESKRSIEHYKTQLLSKAINNLSFISSISKHIRYQQTGNINQANFIELAKKQKLHVGGWPFWDVENFIQYGAAIRSIFEPKEIYRKNAVDFLEKIDKKYDLKFGIHIRQGDYKEYLDGQYFFTTEKYCEIVNDLYQQLKQKGKNPIFIICSNVDVILEDIAFPYIKSDLDAMSDIVLLSKCDFILGPPSTFSQWASFYGQIPSNVIKNASDPILLKDFSPIVAPNTYQSGRHLKDPNN